MKKSLIIFPICTLLLTGCLPDKVAEEIDKVETENQQNEKVEEKKAEDTVPEDIELSEEQLEVLENSEKVSSDNAVNELVDEKESIKVNVPKEKKSFESEEEFSQYLSSLFFLYHTGEIEADLFYDRISPHLHKNFLDMLPKEEADQRETFEILQQTFMQYLPAPIISYELTETAYLERLEEATFYRKYVTKDHEPIYYQTVIRKENGRWLLFDDSPAPPYEINPTVTNSFKEAGGISMIKDAVIEEKEIVVELLKNRYKKDENFKKVIDEASLFYGRKIIGFAKDTIDQRFVEDNILEVICDQFFLGYFLMDQILKDPEFTLDESYWSLAEGFVRNGIYPLLESVMEGSEVQWQQSAAEKKFTKRVVANFYDAYEIMVQLRKDILALGAYYAFIECPQYKKPEHPENVLRLANPFDLTFVNPQVFMQTKYANENVEKWVLYQTETIKGGQWVGEIQLERRKNPQGELENYLEMKISHLLEQNDITDIINKMILKIPAEEHSITSIQYYLISVKKEYNLI